MALLLMLFNLLAVNELPTVDTDVFTRLLIEVLLQAVDKLSVCQRVWHK